MAIFRAHGLRFQRDYNALLCLATPPPLYPKLVTLRADANVPPDFSGPSFSGAVKDSFASLDFAMLGMN
ncbi:MAG: hypothetical protein AB8B88_10735, partial [Devosiaceae bacterium]